MLDQYFKRPVVWDFVIGVSLLLLACLFYKFDRISLPCRDELVSSTTDITNICFTSAGFIFTTLTILITFKSGTSITKENIHKSESTFEAFFASELYFETVKHLKNCVKVLIVVAIIGYIAKLFFSKNLFLLLFCVFGVSIVVLTLWRCLLILTRILSLQKNRD
jgi:hypothetical protein